MKPLPRQDAGILRQSLLQVIALLDERNWSAAYESLGVLRDSAAQWHDTPDYGEWCLLRARAAVELGHYGEAIEAGRQAFTCFQLTTDHERMAQVQSVLGKAYLGLGDSKNARIQSRDALGTYRRLGDVPGMARSHNTLARIHFVRGEYPTAAEHLTDGIELFRQLNDRESEARLLGNLGRTRLLEGQWADAREILTQALVCAERTDNEVSMARNLLSLAFVTTLQHEFKQASEYLDGALAHIETVGLARERSIYYEYVGYWHFEQHHWVQAKESFRRALNIGRHLSEQNDLVSQSLRGLADCEAALGGWHQALRLANEGLEVAIAIGERAEVGCLYRARARASAHLHDAEDAESCLSRAYECLNLVGDAYEIARCNVIEAEIRTILAPDAVEESVIALNRAATRFSQLGATGQLHEVQWMLVDAHCRNDALDDALQLAQTIIGSSPAQRTSPGSGELLQELAQRCVRHAASDTNEFRLGGMPWTSSEDDEPVPDTLQQAVDFYRLRLGVSRVILVEVTAEGKRTGRVMATSNADQAFAERVAAYAANPYQQHLSASEPKVYWSIECLPELAAALTDDDATAPRSAMCVPVELGPGADGVLYADVASDSPQAQHIRPRDVDFAVAFAEVIGWQSTRLRSEGLFRDVQRLRDQLGQASEFPSIITQNSVFQQILSRARLIVEADVSVLLQGETGTGKDLLAKAIHYTSNRRDRRFVSVNCAALPESLLESELFGVKRGAFTGADRDKTGLFEEADGGTFFLDEIGEMPLSVQSKLLRFLETKEFTRLGDTKPRHVDVRVISATNRDLSDEVERRTFRRDLFYRLSPVTFNLPPLRERPEDVPLLVDHFMARISAETGRKVTLAAETVRAMGAYHWPGNVRELDNEVRKLVLLSGPDERIGVDRLSSKFHEPAHAAPVSLDAPIPEGFCLYNYVSNIEQTYIMRAIADAGGVKKHAAKLLGIPESTLRLKMKQLDKGTPG